MKVYTSKEDVYEDFDIAVKFVLNGMHHFRRHDEVLNLFATDLRAQVQRFTAAVKNFKQEYPVSIGFYVEIGVEGDTGQEIGTQFVVLNHETGLEIFLKTFLEGAKKVAADRALQLIVDYLRNNWDRIVRGGAQIVFVELRTRDKGVMRLPFSKFTLAQLGCLMAKFPHIKHLKECNAECFGNQLVNPPRPPRPGTLPQANEASGSLPPAVPRLKGEG